MRLLIADDDPAVLALLQRQLSKGGYEVEVASNGQEAWEILQRDNLQLVILDWNMPGLSGVEVCARLQELPQVVYAIVLTGQHDTASVAAALRAGASDYIIKPWSREVLLARVNVGARTVNLHSRLAQAQKLESIGQLAAGIAHEINTPTQYVGDNLRFIKESVPELIKLIEGYSGFANRDDGPPEWSEQAAELKAALEDLDLEFLREELPKALEQSLEGVERVTRIVQSMKKFSHPGGKAKEASDLNSAIESTITVTQNEWKYVAEMVTEFDRALPPVPCLLGDFNQVILNLIINATHAIADVVGQDSGQKGTITVSTRADGDCAEIRISDTGTGIPAKIRSRIFEPFFTTKEVGKGTGQGLAIAHTVIVQRHGGSLSVESKEGKGTTFIIRMPLRAKCEPVAEAD